MKPENSINTRAGWLPALLLLCLLCVPRRSDAQLALDSLLPCSVDTFGTGYPQYSACATWHSRFIALPTMVLLDHYRAYLLLSSDTGHSWVRRPIPLAPWDDFRWKFFNSACFIDSQNIVLSGDSGLCYRTTDAGESWKNQSFANSPYLSLASDFSDSATGVFCAGPAFAPRITTDAGISWRLLESVPKYYYTTVHMRSRDSVALFRYPTGPLFYFDANSGHIDSTQIVFTYDDSNGGYRWISQLYWDNNPDRVFGIGFHVRADQKAGADAQTILVLSEDAGKTWSILIDRDTKLSKGPLAFSTLPDGTAMIAGHGRFLLWTRNWRTGPWYEDSLNTPNIEEQMSSVTLIDPSHAIGWLDGGGLDRAPRGGVLYRITFGVNASVEPHQERSGTLVYPNPCFASIVVEGFAENMKLTDALGCEFPVMKVDNRIDVSSLPPGVYFLTDGKQQARFVKQ